MADVTIDGVSYVAATRLARELGVSRQTLWRWRTEGKIPAGNRFRNGRIVYSPTEAELVRSYAQQLEPLDNAPLAQLPLFEAPKRK